MYSGAYIGRGVFWLPGNPPFGLKSGRYWAQDQERIKYTTVDTIERAIQTGRLALPASAVASRGARPSARRRGSRGYSLHPQLPGYRLRVCT